MGRGDLLHALQHLDAALGLARLGSLVPKPVDKALHVLDLLLLAGIHRLLQRELFGTQLLELAVVAGKQVNRAILDMRDARADLVEEIPVVRYDQQDAFVAFQPALEPQDGRQVQVVGWLVEQQDVGPAHECASEIEPHPPAAGKRTHRVGVLVGREPEAVQQTRRARLGRKAVDGLHAFVQDMEVRPGRVGLTLGNGGLDLPQLVVTVHDVIDGGAVAARAFLRDVGNLTAGVQHEFAAVRLQLAEEHREQRRLATAVGADHADPLAGVSLEAGVFDQDLAAASQVDVCEGEHGRRDYRLSTAGTLGGAAVGSEIEDMLELDIVRREGA